MASSRLPGKPLALIEGQPMIRWVWEAVRAVPAIGEACVATDSDEVRQAVEAFGGRAVMTRSDHKSGTDRVAEVARHLGADVVLNVQGDEPLMRPDVLAALVHGFTRERPPGTAGCPMGTLVAPVADPAETMDPGRAKVVCRRDGRALYFSRSPIPYDRDRRGGVKVYKHIGVYAFRRDFLLEFASLPASELELAEQLEQLRALENGHDIMTVPVCYDGFGVDTPEDLERARRELAVRRPEPRARPEDAAAPPAPCRASRPERPGP
jgi:3-deoxy-manno-octulosonate cytidylyltransferase (CMP-KDO synthetase)